MTKKQTLTIGIAVGIGVLFAAAIYFLMISPQMNSWKTAKDDLVTTQTALTQAQADAAELAGKADQLEATVDAVNELTGQFPTEYREAQIVALLTESATEAGVDLFSVSPGAPGDPTLVDPNTGQPVFTPPIVNPAAEPGVVTENGAFPIAKAVVNVSVKGTRGLDPDLPGDNQQVFQRYVKFLELFESLPRPILISSLQLSSAELGIQGATYLTRPLPAPGEEDPNAAPAPATPAPTATTAPTP